jgi:hypothetical protein
VVVVIVGLPIVPVRFITMRVLPFALIVNVPDISEPLSPVGRRQILARFGKSPY